MWICCVSFFAPACLRWETWHHPLPAWGEPDRPGWAELVGQKRAVNEVEEKVPQERRVISQGIWVYHLDLQRQTGGFQRCKKICWGKKDKDLVTVKANSIHRNEKCDMDERILKNIQWLRFVHFRMSWLVYASRRSKQQCFTMAYTVSLFSLTKIYIQFFNHATKTKSSL